MATLCPPSGPESSGALENLWAMGVRGYGVGHADDGRAKGIEGHSIKTSCYRRWSRAAYQIVIFAPETLQWSYSMVESMVELVEQSRKN